MSKDIISISWSDLDTIVDDIVQEVISSDINIDCILGLSRGGLVPAVMLANKLGTERVYSFGLRSYNGSEAESIKTYQHVGHNMCVESNVLVVDDISDKGATLGYVKRQICADGPDNYVHRNIYTCTICIKKGTDFQPTWYGNTYDNNDWIVFPWEVV
jgi:uncharacterized protein